MNSNHKNECRTSRRTFLKGGLAAAGGLLLARPAGALAAAEAAAGRARVYFTPEVSSEALAAVYQALNHPLQGKVAVKISSGEPGGHNFLDPKLIAPLVTSLEGTIVECCTAYNGRRHEPAEHWKVLREHGFMDIAPCDILDEEGELVLPVKSSFHLKENRVGAHLARYDSVLMLQHFKGHTTAGFGGTIKNMSIGFASPAGKTMIHTAGKTAVCEELFANKASHEHFQECMVDACSSVMDHMKPENLVYVNVANKLSVDCDCDSHPADPKMADLGIFASLDPVALDKACHDAVVNADDAGKADLVERMADRRAAHGIEAAWQKGLGQKDYELVAL